MLERHREILEDMLEDMENPSLLTPEEMEKAIRTLHCIMSDILVSEGSLVSQAENAISALRNICSNLYRNGYMIGQDKVRASLELDSIQDRIVRSTL